MRLCERKGGAGALVVRVGERSYDGLVVENGPHLCGLSSFKRGWGVGWLLDWLGAGWEALYALGAAARANPLITARLLLGVIVLLPFLLFFSAVRSSRSALVRRRLTPSTAGQVNGTLRLHPTTIKSLGLDPELPVIVRALDEAGGALGPKRRLKLARGNFDEADTVEVSPSDAERLGVDTAEVPILFELRNVARNTPWGLWFDPNLGTRVGYRSSLVLLAIVAAVSPVWLSMIDWSQFQKGNGEAWRVQLSQDWQECSGTDTPLATQINACTQLTNSLPPSEQTAELRAIVFYNRGIAYSESKDPESALKDFDESIRLNPNNSDAFMNRGNVHGDKGDLDHAIADYDHAIEIDPSNASAFNNRSNAFFAKKENERAMADLDKAIELDSHFAAAYFNRGLGFAAKGDLDRAIQDFDQAIALDASIDKAFKGRARAYYEKGDLARTIADYDRYLTSQPNDAEILNERCWTHATLGGDLNIALADCTRSLQLKASAEASDSRGLVYLKLGRFSEARADYDQALAQFADYPSSLFGRGIAKRHLGDTASGNADIAAAKKLDPTIAKQFAKYGVKK